MSLGVQNPVKNAGSTQFGLQENEKMQVWGQFVCPKPCANDGAVKQDPTHQKLVVSRTPVRVRRRNHPC